MPLFLFPAIRSGDYYLFDESEDEAEIEAGIDTIKFGMGEEEEKHGISPIEVGVSIVSGDYRSNLIRHIRGMPTNEFRSMNSCTLVSAGGECQFSGVVLSLFKLQ